MRPIKFRAWNEVKKEMLVVFDNTNQKEFYIPLAKDWELIQFTGLHDKNGKEIWEGDILSWKTSNGEWQNSEIRFVKSGFCIVNPEGEELNAYPLSNLLACSRWDIGGEPDAEVIGNIYENADLLK